MDVFKIGARREKPSIPPGQSFLGRSPDREKVRLVRTAAAGRPGPATASDRALIIDAKTRENVKKMLAAEREYHERLEAIHAKSEANFGASHGAKYDHDANIEQKVNKGHATLKQSSVEYKAWLRKKHRAEDERLEQISRDRLAAAADFRARERAKEQKRLAHVEEMKAHDREWQLELARISGVSKPPKKREVPLIRSSSLPAIWDRSLGERAAAEKEYWKWARKVGADAVCHIDHILTSPSLVGTDTAVQLALQESIVREREYFLWTETLKSGKACSIDQSWEMEDGSSAADDDAEVNDDAENENEYDGEDR